jgi:hypothetical protein
MIVVFDLRWMRWSAGTDTVASTLMITTTTMISTTVNPAERRRVRFKIRAGFMARWGGDAIRRGRYQCAFIVARAYICRRKARR